jgi:hypothetical protein
VVDYLGGKVFDLDTVMEPGTRCADLGVGDQLLRDLRRSCRDIPWKGRVKRIRTHASSALLRYVPVTPSLGRLIGLYLAEGSLHRGGVEWTFGGHEEHYAAEVLALVRGLFGVEGNLVRPPGHNVIRVRVTNTNFRHFMGAFCPGNAGTKRVPSVFFNADEDTKNALIVGWMNGDGHTSVSDSVNIVGTTASEGLGRDLTVLALSCGLRANCTLLPHYRGYANRYIVRLNGPKALALFPALAATVAVQGKKVHQRDSRMCQFGYMRHIQEITTRTVVDEPVYDFEVEEDHSFLAGDIVSHNCMTVNKVAEMVQLFGPVLYHRNPVRTVTPRRHPMLPPELFGGLQDPMMSQYFAMLFQQVEQQRGVDLARAHLLEHYLNYTPQALDLKNHARWAIDEAIIKGMGLLWTEVYTSPGGAPKMIGSFYDSVDNLVIDSDMESIEEAKWVARRCVHPCWEVERLYNLPPGTIKGSMESHGGQASTLQDQDYRRAQGTTNDLCVYWKVYSKMGLGGRLAGIQPDLREALEPLGDHCFLVLCDKVDYPLNLPPEVMAQGIPAIQAAIQWPTPHWADGTWPFTRIEFHTRPRKVWPMSHLKPGMGELKFINWVYSFITGKIRTACRDFLAIKEQVEEEITNTIINGTDYELVRIKESHEDINKIVQFLQHPPFHGDIWQVLKAVEENFERRVGLTELMYGQSRAQFRSASEAQVKADQTKIRPDDMAQKVEEAMSCLARMEAFAVRWHLKGSDVAPVMGPAGQMFWDQLITPSNPTEILHNLETRVEAGTARKPNKDREVANMQEAMRTLFQPLWQLAMQTGQTGPVNSLVTDWCKSIDLDPQKYQIAAPPPPMPMPAPPSGPSGGQDQQLNPGPAA